jgi:hypothetical protein
MAIVALQGERRKTETETERKKKKGRKEGRDKEKNWHAFSILTCNFSLLEW